MQKIVALLLFVSLFTQAVKAQRYIIRFRDKATTSYSLSHPSPYLSLRAIERRQRFSIPVDSTDLPVPASYLDSLRSVPGVILLNTSRWLNQVSVQITNATALDKINSFPFVFASSRIAKRTRTDGLKPGNKFGEADETAPAGNSFRTATDFYTYGNAQNQIQMHNGAFLHNIGLRGENIIIGMLDAGYQNYTTVSAFDSVRKNGQILGTWDFVSRNATVSDDHQHGTQCFSTIAANVPGRFVGSAPKAAFYLFRTEESATEYAIEEHNWVCGAERLDSAGGDLISSSLGYAQFDDASLNHTYADLNGNTTIAAIGADLAAKKGILVINSAGNEGNKAWKYLLTPADADSILVVGSVTSARQVSPFSSFGPAADGQVKPDVASMGSGTTIQSANGTIGTGNGTSYAAPNLAGLVACLMQGFPEYNNMQIIQAIRSSGSNATAPDDRTGYGIPDMKKALLYLLQDFSTARATTTNCRATINWTSKDIATMKYEIERKATGEQAFKKIGERGSAASSFSTSSYQFTDTLYGLPEGTVTYRIRQIIDTAAASVTGDYIDTVTVEAGALCVLNDLNRMLQSLQETATSNVVLANCTATLNWSSNDIAAMSYQIERKTPMDNDYQKIGQQGGTGSVFAPHSYQFIDHLKGLPAGNVSYRILQIADTSGANFTAAYIDTANAELIPSCSLTEAISLIPNPAPGQFVLQTTIEQPIPELLIRITTMQGSVLAEIKKTKPAGVVNFEIPVSAFSPGLYLVSVYDKNELLATKKLIKL